MYRTRIFLFLLAAVLLADNCSCVSDIYGNDNVIELKVPDNHEDTVDLQLLENVGKRASLLYAYGDCAILHEICYYTPFGPFKACCPGTHCYCYVVNCYCSDNISLENGNEDKAIIVQSNIQNE